MDKVILTIFTDPMMGLSYESEPIMERLEKEYGDRVEFRYVMSLLVRDVSDFMTTEELDMEPDLGIRHYCNRLAQIYKNEEPLGCLPINMDNFCLFDINHRSSRPLNLAYKAAQLSDPDKADTFLTALRHATVKDCLPTTHFDIILHIVRKTRLNETSFIQHYQSGSADFALEKDLAYTHNLGIHVLPSYMFQYADKAIIMQSFEYQDFAAIISELINEWPSNKFNEDKNTAVLANTKPFGAVLVEVFPRH